MYLLLILTLAMAYRVWQDYVESSAVPEIFVYRYLDKLLRGNARRALSLTDRYICMHTLL